MDMAQKQSRRDLRNRHYLTSKNESLQEDAHSPRYISEIKRWVSPLMMEAINSKIVYRSLMLIGSDAVSENFQYRESFKLGGSYLSNRMGTAGLNLMETFARNSCSRMILGKLLRKAGEGPSEESIEKGFFKAVTIARLKSGKSLSFSLLSQGDPSNRSTIKLIGSTTKALLAHKEGGPCGLLTPASAFGKELFSFLENEEIIFSDAKDITISN